MRETERKASLPDTCDNEHTFEAQGRDQDDRGAESSLDSLPTYVTVFNITCSLNKCGSNFICLILLSDMK